MLDKLFQKKTVVILEFKGVDDWYRPIFFDKENKDYYGDVNCTKTGKPNDVKEFYKKNIHLLEYFGKSFGCEPHGGINKNIKLKII